MESYVYGMIIGFVVLVALVEVGLIIADKVLSEKEKRMVKKEQA